MDSLTHAAIGACIGELTLGKKLGRHALWVGALAQNLPDIDIVAALWLPFSQNLIVHRGITHSFVFGAGLALLLAFILAKWPKTRTVGFTAFLLFFLGQIFLHDLLDTCNAYGTGLWLPFSETRFSWHLLYVADPLFTIWPILAVLALLFVRGTTLQARKGWAILGLLLPLGYLGYANVNKAEVNRGVDASIAKQGLRVQSYFTTPTAFNNWLWYVVAASDSGYHIGYRSVFEKQDATTAFTYYPRNSHLLTEHPDQQEVQALKQFAAGYYTAQQKQDTLLFNVLRFGQVMGWRDTTSSFAFHYYLNPKLDNTLAVQRGRFKGWDSHTVKQLFHRIFKPDEGQEIR
ncbi:metal-dependent hydrolase [Nibribacter koreensis]|uniref:Metal-dependent hydrolase n=1 Tax=Nibribacter koreensis TaxID=1084519 RepID=A0ABP8FQV4_9BACT